jgi:uncharacterized protein GlcG (DUF336 family)
MKRILFAAVTFFACALPAAPQTMSYGPSITADAAKKVAAPAIAEARKNNWMMAIAIVDPSGDLVYFEQGALGGAFQASDQSVPGCARRRRRGAAHSRVERRRAG